MTRAGVRALGLDLFADPAYASDTVTAFHPPVGISARALLDLPRRDHGVEAQGGQAHLADAIVRIDHMGWAHEPDLREALTALERSLATLTGSRPAAAAAVGAVGSRR